MIDLDVLEVKMMPRGLQRPESMVRLEEVTMDDIALYEAIHCGSNFGREPIPAFAKEAVLRVLENALAMADEGQAWVYKIVPTFGSLDPVGTVGIWQSELYDKPINEIAWTVLPQHQGRGYATQAIRAILERDAFERKWKRIHALPSVANAASNTICRKTGFDFVGSCEVDYAGHEMICNHWTLNTSRIA